MVVKLSQNYYNASFSGHICLFFFFLMKLATIFQVLEEHNDVQTCGYGGQFVFQNEAPILQTCFHKHSMQIW